jgi:hypothetical protein
MIKKRLLQLAFLVFVLPLGLMAQTKSPKRGFGGDVPTITDAQASSKFAWYYNWGWNPHPNVINNVQNYLEYAPMCWDDKFDSTALVNYLTAHPEVKYLLGFNEPNFLEQANLTPRQAAAQWPKVEAIANRFGLKLVSPALNFCYTGGAVIENGVEYTDPVQYLDSFFANCVGCKVDYIAIHGYFDHPAALPWYVDLFRKYNKPLWLTEFNHSASWVSDQSQQHYMVEALNYLEKEPLIYKYAWFLARSPQTNTNLFLDQAGALTDLGLIYANMSSYDTAYFHAANNTIQAEHYIDMSGIHLIKVQDTSGILAAHDFDAGDWMDYHVNVPSTGTYNLGFRLTSIQTASLSVYSGSTLLGTLQIPNTGGFESWQTVNLNVNLTAGKQKLRIVTHGGGWKLNSWKINAPVTTGCSAPLWNSQTSYSTGTIVSLNNHQWQATKASINKQPGTNAGKQYWKDLGVCSSTSVLQKTQQSLKDSTGSIALKVYPNPVTNGSLYIETVWVGYDIEVMDLQAKTLLYQKNNAGSKKLDISFLKPGTYLLKVHFAGENKVQKIVVK